MSDFERAMLKRGQEIEAERLEAAAKQEAQRAGEVVERAEAERQALKMGREIVELLQKYQVPSRSMWERLPTCPATKSVAGRGPGLTVYTDYSRDAQYYRYLGEGWEVCNVSHYDFEGYESNTHAGITDSGQVMIGAFNYNGTIQTDHAVSSILIPKLAAPHEALGYLESDDFQSGIASLISGQGAYIDKKSY